MGYAIKDNNGFVNLKEGLNLNLKKIKFYPCYWKITKISFNLDFTPFHLCYVNEPFGDSIYFAVDFGKLPILNNIAKNQLQI